MGVAIHTSVTRPRGQVLKVCASIAETQKWRAELLESIETAVTKCFIVARQRVVATFAAVAWRHSVMLAIC